MNGAKSGAQRERSGWASVVASLQRKHAKRRKCEEMRVESGIEQVGERMRGGWVGARRMWMKDERMKSIPKRSAKHPHCRSSCSPRCSLLVAY